MKFLLLISVFLLTACNGSTGPNVKLYVSDPSQNGLVRKQANEIIPYSASKGYIALSASDAEALLNYCLGPQGVSLNTPEIQSKIKEITANGY